MYSITGSRISICGSSSSRSVLIILRTRLDSTSCRLLLLMLFPVTSQVTDTPNALAIFSARSTVGYVSRRIQFDIVERGIPVIREISVIRRSLVNIDVTRVQKSFIPVTIGCE